MTANAATTTVALVTSPAQAAGVAREFAASIAPGTIERDRTGNVPARELAALDASGLLGITVPREHGGPDLPASALADVIRVIAAVDPAIAQVPQSHFLFVDVLAALGTQHQRLRLFGDVLSGARLANGLAERGGQHAQDLETRLSGGTRLTGHKYYCTGARFDDVPVDECLVLPYYEAFTRPQLFGARTQLVHAAIQVGSALQDAGEFVRTRARPFFEAARAGWTQTAGQDPHSIRRFGELATKVRAAEALLTTAAATLDEIGRAPRDAAAAARGSIAVAQAKAFGSDVAVEVASDIFSLTGASAADERYDLSRHWRNARTHASHDPVAWKYHHVGNHLLNHTAPPNHGQI